jgi:hypothetical protein
MEALVILGIIGGLAVLSPRFGHDSRERLQSNEEQLARLGVTWGNAAPQPVRTPRHRVRHQLARLLYALAAWLNPELRRARA